MKFDRADGVPLEHRVVIHMILILIFTKTTSVSYYQSMRPHAPLGAIRTDDDDDDYQLIHIKLTQEIHTYYPEVSEYSCNVACILLHTYIHTYKLYSLFTLL